MNFSGQNFIKGSDGGGIFEESRKNSKAIRFRIRILRRLWLIQNYYVIKNTLKIKYHHFPQIKKYIHFRGQVT